MDAALDNEQPDGCAAGGVTPCSARRSFATAIAALTAWACLHCRGRPMLRSLKAGFSALPGGKPVLLRFVGKML